MASSAEIRSHKSAAVRRVEREEVARWEIMPRGVLVSLADQVPEFVRLALKLGEYAVTVAP